MEGSQQSDPFAAYEPGGGSAPAAQAQPASSKASGPRAGFWSRFGAYLLDTILLNVVFVPLNLLLPTGVYIAIALPLGIAYFALLEGGPRGQTVGKMALGIRVIDLTRGGPIGYGRAIIRYVGRIASAIVILLGYLWMLWDKEKQTWHDKMATSVVVPTSSYPVG